MPNSSIFIVIIFASLVAILSWYRSPKQKGKRGEAYVSKILQKIPQEYKILNDLVFQTERGTTQVDHVIISKYGIFVIETKNYNGEIYGDDERKEWTQIFVNNVTYRRRWWKTYTYVTKNKFYNPIKQAYGHVYRIKDLLKDYPYIPIIPIVVFAGGADISNVNSHNHVIYKEQLLYIIDSYKKIYISDQLVSKYQRLIICNNVRETVENKTHVKNLRKAAQETQNKINAGICPNCGGQLIKREGKYGAFYGCSNYPNCKFTTK